MRFWLPLLIPFAVTPPPQDQWRRLWLKEASGAGLRFTEPSGTGVSFTKRPHSLALFPVALRERASKCVRKSPVRRRGFFFALSGLSRRLYLRITGVEERVSLLQIVGERDPGSCQTG